MQRNQNIDISKVKVPVKQEDGSTQYESLNQGGKQSDGSMWYKPEPLIDPKHKHFFKMKPDEREAKCECGFGGAVYPHNSIFKAGHIYNLRGQLVI